MKITESYLRKIIRGAINEMMSGADATPSFHDSPPPEKMPTQSPQQLVDQLVAQVTAGKIDSTLLGKLQKAIEAANQNTTQPSATPFGTEMRENKKRR